MGAFKDLSGQKFNRLTAIRIAEKRGKNYYYECVCDCGNTKLVRACQLTSGGTKSCGCLQREKVSGDKPKKGNAYRIEDGVAYVKLTNSDEEFMCDESDWNAMSKYTWFKDAYGYPCANTRGEKNRTTKFHLMILGTKDGLVVDHINRNKLDNRRENLRFVTQHINSINKGMNSNNTSGYTGVKFRKDIGKWSARIMFNYKDIALGCYDTKEEAIEARKRGEEKYFQPLLQTGEEYECDTANASR